jgi:hypothetical protein
MLSRNALEVLRIVDLIRPVIAKVPRSHPLAPSPKLGEGEPELFLPSPKLGEGLGVRAKFSALINPQS